MDRKDFIKNCGYACLGTSTIGIILQSCVSTRTVSAKIDKDQLVIARSNFIKNGKAVDYIIATNNKLQYPIYVFQFSKTEYSALYLRCTHQGSELSAFGDKLICSAHGSEFDNKGNVTQGPASEKLRQFPIRIENDNLILSLRKI